MPSNELILALGCQVETTDVENELCVSVSECLEVKIG